MALEVIGGAFFSAFFQSLFQKMDSQEVRDFLRGKKRTDALVEKLKSTLRTVDVVIDDAEGKSISNSKLKDWLDELQEVVSHAEDLLDEIKTEASKRTLKATGSKVRKVRQFISDSFHDLHKSVDSSIEAILEKLESIVKRKEAFNLEAGASTMRLTISSTKPSTTSLVPVSGMYGRDKEKETIIKLLIPNDATSGSKVDVIPIVGMGGIGKTTLAQLLYNDVTVEKHFNRQAWVCVSDEYDVIRITRQIYMSVTNKETCDVTDLNMLQEKLKNALTNKKFLFVLDDIWNDNYNDWDCLRTPFQAGTHGSKIIVTTRSENVASRMGTLPSHCLKVMSEDDCWELFKAHAFQNSGVSAVPNIEVIGRQIVKKCKGLPLAAKSLGGLLRSDFNIRNWECILHNEIWALSDKDSNTLPALWLSYQHLSSQLKRCFAYCAVFPKDYEFEKSELALLWMAEGLLQPLGNIMMEEVGENYFDDLVSRSFFQKSPNLYHSFTMHDLIHDLAIFVYGKFCIRLEDSGTLDNVSKAIHCSCMHACGGELHFEELNALYEAKHLRTFLSSGLWLPKSPQVSYDLFPKLKCLRVLSLQSSFITELPESVRNLQLLRQLDLSRTSIIKLPDAICSLYNLQTLLLSGCRKLAQLPSKLGKLVNLRHLHLIGTSIIKLPDTICSLYNLQTLLLSSCCKLAQLPSKLGKLVNLRHLDIKYTNLEKMPPHMSKLKDLQRLRGEFVLDKDSWENIVELKELQYLHGTLCILGLRNVVHAMDALQPNILRDKKYLNELVLNWGGDTNDSKLDAELLDSLQPHVNLAKLEINTYGGTEFPDWVGYHSFSNLFNLRLDNCGNCCTLPALHAPNLTHMSIIQCKKLRSLPEQMHSLLPSLQTLIIDGCPELESFPEGGLPLELKSLDIGVCKKLNANRRQWGLQRLTSLRCLRVQFVECEEEIEESFPEEGLLPITLTCLYIVSLDSKTINGKGLRHLISLETLRIKHCLQLQRLPDEGLPSSLSRLEFVDCPLLQHLPDEGLPSSLSPLLIKGCPLLSQRCKREEGEDWPKISHIPNLIDI